MLSRESRGHSVGAGAALAKGRAAGVQERKNGGEELAGFSGEMGLAINASPGGMLPWPFFGLMYLLSMSLVRVDSQEACVTKNKANMMDSRPAEPA